MKKEANLIIEFPVIVPDDYSIAGFRRRNPDSFYEMAEGMIDRHFPPSNIPKTGTKMTAAIYELSGEWLFGNCLELIKEKSGLLPNAVGLTMAFEQGERYLRVFKKPWPDASGEHRHRSQNIFGLDTGKNFWWTNDDGILIPCLYSQADPLSRGVKWKFAFQATQLFGNKEDCLLFFRER